VEALEDSAHMEDQTKIGMGAAAFIALLSLAEPHLFEPHPVLVGFLYAILAFVLVWGLAPAIKRRVCQRGFRRMWPQYLMVISGGAFFVGLVAFLQMSARPDESSTSGKHVSAPAPVPASVLFEWKWAKLPATVPSSGTVMAMSISSEKEVGAHILYLGARPGAPGDKLSWNEDSRQYASVYRGEITNYADFPIFNLAMTFKTEFFEVVPDINNPGSARSGALVESYDRPVVINKLDPKETFAFYAYSDSQMYVHVSMPESITYVRDTLGPRETARLLPQFEKSISLFPLTFVEKKTEGGGPKGAPAPK
jgi:hypothetical protein